MQDSTPWTVLLFDLSKYVAWAIVLIVWIRLFKKNIIPYIKNELNPRVLSVWNISFALFVFILAAWFWNYEPSFRNVHSLNSPGYEQRMQQTEQKTESVKSGEVKVDSTTQKKSLEQKTQEKLQQTEQENQEGKAKFDSLPDAKKLPDKD